MITIVNKADGVKKEFNSNTDYINFVRNVFAENEHETANPLVHLQDVYDCNYYIDRYCENLTLIL